MSDYTPKEIRNLLLKAIYESENRYRFDLNNGFKYRTYLIGKDKLEKEIIYLEDKGYLKRINRTLDNNYELAITKDGIDYLENPEKTQEESIKENNYYYGNITNSNISTNSLNTTQTVKTTNESFIDKIISTILNFIKKVLKIK